MARHNRNMASQECARKRIIKKRGKKCEKCGYTGYIELDHIIEVKNGGTFADDNLMLLCEKCHADKHGYKKKRWLDPFRKNWRGA